MSKICESGRISASGKLLLPMDRVNAFLEKNKGKRVIVQFEAVEHGTTKAQRAYYYGYILPCVVEALKGQGNLLTKEIADAWLLDIFPVNVEATVARDLTKEQMSEFIEWLKEFAAENLDIYIEDPQTI